MDGDETLYKALYADGRSPYQSYEWPLPTKNGRGWEPGEWVDAGEGELAECEHGLHACTVEQLPRWLHETLYVLEPAPGTDVLEGEDKIVVRRARLARPVETWNENTSRLFAADCAELVLPLYEDEHPDDERPRKAIETARAYARGEVGQEELASVQAAVQDAAQAAAQAAAWAARNASPAAQAAAQAAAWSAAWYAALSAAWAARNASRAAQDAVQDAVRGWIADRLALYFDRGAAAAEEPVPDIREIMGGSDE